MKHSISLNFMQEPSPKGQCNKGKPVLRNGYNSTAKWGNNAGDVLSYY